MHFAPKNCFFSLFCELQTMKMEFFSNFAPIVLCSNLFSALLIIGEKLLKNPFSFLAVYKKGSKSNFLEQNTIFFKRSSLRSQTFLSVSQTCWDTLYRVKIEYFE